MSALDEFVEAAAKALGASLVLSETLLSGGRTTVLRCTTARADQAASGSVVVKAYLDEPDARRGFAHEAAGLAFGVAGPGLLGVDRRVPLIVMEDLGTAPSLADRLLGDDPVLARQALLAWAGGLGQLAVATAGREAEFAALRDSYDLGDGPWPLARWHTERSAQFQERLSTLGITVPAGLAEELDEVRSVTDPASFPVFSPGDVCPDNNLITRGGLRVFDFEGAGYRCAFLDAAYTRMPFSTCWCVYDLPEPLSAEVEHAYRALVAGIYPQLRDDARWHMGVRYAMVVWTVFMTALLLHSVAEQDRPTHRTRRPVATWRQVLRYRWSRLRDELSVDGLLPATVATMDKLLAATESWDVAPLPVYPALRPLTPQ